MTGLYKDVNELEAILEYLDKEFDVKKISFVPEKETSKILNNFFILKKFHIFII